MTYRQTPAFCPKLPFMTTPANGWVASEIGIGGRLATPPLPHHRAYGSVPRRFDRVKLAQASRVGGDEESRRSDFAGRDGPPGVRTCARVRSVNRQQGQK